MYHPLSRNLPPKKPWKRVYYVAVAWLLFQYGFIHIHWNDVSSCLTVTKTNSSDVWPVGSSHKTKSQKGQEGVPCTREMKMKNTCCLSLLSLLWCVAQCIMSPLGAACTSWRICFPEICLQITSQQTHIHTPVRSLTLPQFISGNALITNTVFCIHCASSQALR